MTEGQEILSILTDMRDTALRHAVLLDEENFPQGEIEALRYEAGIFLKAIEAVTDYLDAANDEVDEHKDRYTDAEADSDTFASVGWGTDEDYGYYGSSEY